MKKKKVKIISFLLVVFLAMSLVACNESSGTNETTKATTKATTKVTTAVTTTTVAAVDVEICDPERPLRSLQARQALSYAIDRKAITEQFFRGYTTPANTLTPIGKAEGLDEYEYNPEKAKELLAACEWPEDYTIGVYYIYDNQETADLMAVIQNYWKAVGVKMTAKLVKGDYTKILWVEPVNYDIYYGAKGVATVAEFYTQYLSKDPNNSTVQPNEELDELILNFSTEMDPDKRAAALEEFTKYENEHLFWLPLYHMPDFYMFSDRMIPPADLNSIEFGSKNYFYDIDIINWDVKPDAKGEKVVYESAGNPGQDFIESPWGSIKRMTIFPDFDPLIFQHTDGTFDKPCLAKTFEVSADNKQIDLELRDNIFWHDGEKITAEDIRWTWEFGSKVAYKNKLFQATIESLEGYQDFAGGKADHISGIIIDGNKITFKFAKEDPNYLVTFGQFVPLPQKYFNEVSPEEFQTADFWQKPIGSGPYMYKTIEFGNYAEKIAFDKYWAGTPKIKRVVGLMNMLNGPAMVAKARTGEIDFILTASFDAAYGIEELDDYTIITWKSLTTRYMWINNREKGDDY